MNRLALLLLAAGLVSVAACSSSSIAVEDAEPASENASEASQSSDTGTAQSGDTETDSEAAASSAGVRLVSAAGGAAILEDAPEGLVVLDVRTLEEFTEARLDGATMLDFYRDDFAEQLAELDRDVPYLLYCRSGNRSGQTSDMMEALGFSDVAEVDGGILSWNGASLPTVSG